MKDLERTFGEVDFSRHTDLKARLADRLFAHSVSKKTIPFRRLSDDDVEFVNAAQGLYVDEQDKNPGR